MPSVSLKNVSLGFDAWFANGGGDYYNPEFVTRGVPGLKNGLFRTKNYSTSAIGNVSISWIKSVAGKKPFFAYIAPKAAHEPFNPAPWYENFWNDSWPMHEPRPPNYNCSHDSRKDHHGNIATQPMLTREAAEVVTAVFKNRWRTLMSVDDLVFEVLQTIKQLDLSDNTYVFYTSDHGFQLGQFNLLMDKRHVYDWNTRIPFVVTGPGIPKSKAFELPATQVDLAPTFLELAGVGVDLDVFDGLSLVSNLRKSIDEASPAFSSRSLTWKPEIQPRQKWRTSVFFEYYFNNDNTKCVHGCTSQKCASSPLKAPMHDRSCGVIATRKFVQRLYPHFSLLLLIWNDPTGKKCWCKPDGHNASSCYPTEDNSNNYIAIRTFGTNNQLLYAEFASGDQGKQDVDFDTTSFIEIYNVSNDPWMMKNLRNVIPVTTRIWLHRLLRDWYACKGNSCK